MHNPFNDCNLTVIDSVMGSGKSTYAIKLINSRPEENFIVVVPTLDEVSRYQQAITRETATPNADTESGYKLLRDRFKFLAEQNKTIITTHALLEAWDYEALAILKERHYTLILDEVTDLVRPFDSIKGRDFAMLKNDNVVQEELQPDGLIKIVLGSNPYTDDQGKKLAFSNFVESVSSGFMYRVRDSFFIWVGSSERFRVFDSVIVLTYLFKGSVMEAWLSYHGDQYQLKSLACGLLVDYQDIGGETIKHLINLLDCPVMNRVGSGNKLSRTWYKHKATASNRQELADNMRRFFRTAGVTAEEAMWSVYKDQALKIKPKGYTSIKAGQKVSDIILSLPTDERVTTTCWLPINSKATNSYRHKQAVAYMVNVRAFPAITGFFQDVGIIFDEE